MILSMAWKTVDGNGGKKEQVEYVDWTTPGHSIEGTFLGGVQRDDLEFPNVQYSVRTNGHIKKFFGTV